MSGKTKIIFVFSRMQPNFMAQNSSHVKVGEVILKQKKNNKNTDTTAHRPVYRGSGVTVRLSRFSPLFIGDVRWCQCFIEKSIGEELSVYIQHLIILQCLAGFLA
jgi:hypothetical protein